MRHGLYERSAAAGLVVAAIAAAGCGSVRSCTTRPPTKPEGQYLYAVHDAPDSVAPGIEPRISALRIDPASGGLTPVPNGSISAGAVGAFSIAVDPSGRWFSLAGSQLALLRITASGAVEPAQPASGGLKGIFDSKGRFFFLVTGQGLSVFPVHPRSGVQLSRPLHTESGVLAVYLQVSRDGRLLYAARENQLRVYSVGDHGALTLAPGSPVTLRTRPQELALHPSGRFLLALADVQGRSVVSVLRADTDGTVAEVDGSPFEIGNEVRSMVLSADGAHLFVTDRDRHSIETFALDASGALQVVASTPMDVPEAGALQVEPGNRYLYASSMKSGMVHGFAIGDGGTLTPVHGSPFTVGPRVCELVAMPHAGGPLQAAMLPEPGTVTAPREVARADPSTFGAASLDTLVAALHDPSDDTRYLAIVALARRTDLGPALPSLIEALSDPHQPVSRTARLIVGPWALAHPGSVDDAVLGRIVSGANGRGTVLDNGSLTALHALKARGAVATPYLAQALVNSGQLRDEAMDALMSLGPAAVPAVPELRRLLQQPTNAKRYAASALGWIGPGAADAMPELYELLEDQSPSVQRAAKFAIGRIRASE
jgi:6-phosphogluconolactonase (cycloisomerase 2 family)